MEEYLKGGMNGVQIAANLGICNDTLYRRCEEVHKVTFAVYAQEKREKGNGIIHYKQYLKAVRDENMTALIHLGKFRLGQKDNAEKDEAPREENIELKKELYAALYRLQILEEELKNVKSQTGQELQRSDAQI